MRTTRAPFVCYISHMMVLARYYAVCSFCRDTFGPISFSPLGEDQTTRGGDGLFHDFLCSI